MQISNGVICALDETDKNLIIPKHVTGADYFVADLALVQGFDSITVDKDNRFFIVRDGCLIMRDQKILIAAANGAKIPDDGSVTSIAPGAFMFRDDLDTIQIPSQIKTIGYCAFANTSLKAVVIKEGLQSLDCFAFAFNDGLKELFLPKSLQTITNHPFLEKVPFLVNEGYKKTLYKVYKDSCAHRWAIDKKLRYALRGE
ncbi:MAG: leucine-rich repeat domain-containing protein [Clostridia bacterium]|nr:leucine-rich repeat domain-containing protein [Clostridia bacterium]